MDEKHPTVAFRWHFNGHVVIVRCPHSRAPQARHRRGPCACYGIAREHDVVQTYHCQAVTRAILDNGFAIVRSKHVLWTPSIAERFYLEHKGRHLWYNIGI